MVMSGIRVNMTAVAVGASGVCRCQGAGQEHQSNKDNADYSPTHGDPPSFFQVFLISQLCQFNLPTKLCHEL